MQRPAVRVLKSVARFLGCAAAGWLLALGVGSWLVGWDAAFFFLSMGSVALGAGYAYSGRQLPKALGFSPSTSNVRDARQIRNVAWLALVPPSVMLGLFIVRFPAAEFGEIGGVILSLSVGLGVFFCLRNAANSLIAGELNGRGHS